MLSFLLAASLSGVQIPPARYDHPPAMRMQVIEGTNAQIQRVCRLASKYRGELEILACAIPGKTVCIMIWPKGKPRSGPLWRHERAHCNGWRH